MKKLIGKSALVVIGYMAFAFIANCLLAWLTNELYWNVSSSWVYNLTSSQYSMFVGVYVMIVFGAAAVCAVLRVKEEVKHYKEVNNK